MQDPSKGNTLVGNLVDRRSFLRNTALTGAGIAGATLLSTNLQALQSSPTSPYSNAAPGLTATDVAVLQFALNLEYLEAEFYSYVVTGRNLEDNGVPIYGPIGTPGPTSGGVKVRFDKIGGVGPLHAVARQLMHDEVEHVLLLRSVLGPDLTIAKPAIKLNALGSFDDLRMYLTLARDFEVTGVSAYGGAVTLISKAILQYAAQIALVEALHSGNLQLLCELNKVDIEPLDQLDIVPPPEGVNYFDDSYDKALAVIRNTSQVLSIVYGDSHKGTSKGGFFPEGVNGAITTV